MPRGTAFRDPKSVRTRRRQGWATPLIAACLAGTAGTAAAQQAPAPQSAQAAPAAQGGLEEITVTAEKRSSTVQDTPLSITALPGDQLQSQGTDSVAAIAAQTPGISMRSAGPGQTELEMRGMASSGGSSPTVGFYLDETPLTPPAASLNGKVVIDPDLFDLNRVEVLRGPQGTLYGAGSMGGTIKLVTNEPDPTKYAGNIDGILSGTEGGGVNPNLNAMLNIPIVDDKVALRIVGTEKYVGGWIDRIVTEPFPLPTNPCAAYLPGVGCERGNVLAGTTKQDIPNVNWEWLQGGRASLLVKPIDGLKIETTLMYQRITMGGYSQYDMQPGPDPVEAHYQPFNTAEPFSDTFRLYSTTIDYDLGFAELTSATSYWSREEKQSQDASEALRSDILGYYGTNVLAPILFTENDYSHQFSEEMRLASSDAGPIQWIGGAFYSELSSTFFDINQSPAFAAASVGGAAANPEGIVYNSDNPYHVTQYAIFGEGSYQFTDEWKLTLGLRWFDFSTHVDEIQTGSLTASGNATPSIAHFDTSASGFTPKFNLAWQPSPDLTVYATASKGFRPGGVNLPLPPYCSLTKETYGPDSIWDYEIGEKAKLFDNRVTVNADFFYIQWTGVQQLVNQTCGYSMTTSAGNAESFGPELELTARLTPDLVLTVDGAYTDAKLTSVNPTVAANTSLTVGTPILNIPKYTESTSLTYTHPINDDYVFMARATNSYVGPSTDISFGYVDLEPYDIINLRTGIMGEHWSGYFFIDNLTNKAAQLSTNTTSFSWLIPSLTRVATNQPRTFGIDVNYRF